MMAIFFWASMAYSFADAPSLRLRRGATPSRAGLDDAAALEHVRAMGVLYSSERFGRRAIMAGGFLVAAAAVLGTLADSVAAIVLSLVALCVGMFMVQGTAPAFVNATASDAKGGAGALYTTFYYLGAALGSVLPGYAWQAWGWPGVVGACLASFAAGLLSVVFLCA
jgi:predicted MFS family arabinose efflux permease